MKLDILVLEQYIDREVIKRDRNRKQEKKTSMHIYLLQLMSLWIKLHVHDWPVNSSGNFLQVSGSILCSSID